MAAIASNYVALIKQRAANGFPPVCEGTIQDQVRRLMDTVSFSIPVEELNFEETPTIPEGATHVRVPDPQAGIIPIIFHFPDGGVELTDLGSAEATMTIRGKNQVLRIEKTMGPAANISITNLPP